MNSFYQGTDHSRYCHPLQPCGAEGRLLGKSSALAKGKKLCAHRNRLYLFKYINALYLNQYLDSYFQSGGNSNETMHQWIEQSFLWTMRQTLGLERTIPMQEIKKFAYNFMKSRKLIEMQQQDISRNTYFSTELNDKLFKLFSESIQLDDLRREKLDNNENYACGLLYFDCERRLKKLTHYFNHSYCINSKSSWKSNDFEKLTSLIEEYKDNYIKSHNNNDDNDDNELMYEIINANINKEVNGDNYYDDDDVDSDNYYDDDTYFQFPLDDNDDEISFQHIAQQMLNDVLYDEQTNKKWMQTLNGRFAVQELAEFITDNFIGCNSDSNGDTSSGEDEVLLNGNEIDDVKDEDKKEDEDEDIKDEKCRIIKKRNLDKQEFCKYIYILNDICIAYTYIYIYSYVVPEPLHEMRYDCNPINIYFEGLQDKHLFKHIGDKHGLRDPERYRLRHTLIPTPYKNKKTRTKQINSALINDTLCIDDFFSDNEEDWQKTRKQLATLSNKKSNDLSDPDYEPTSTIYEPTTALRRKSTRTKKKRKQKGTDNDSQSEQKTQEQLLLTQWEDTDWKENCKIHFVMSCIFNYICLYSIIYACIYRNI